MVQSKQRVFKLILVLLIALALAPPLSARVIKVPDQYSTIPEAINAASGGDTIKVGVGTYNSGGGLMTVTKRLTIIGNGYKEISNGGSHVGGGFDLTANADRAKIMRFKFIESQNPNINIQDACNRVVITENYFPQPNWAIQSYGDNDTITKNIIRGGIYMNEAIENVINNNILYSAYSSYLIQAQGNCAFLKIHNNVFSNSSYAFTLGSAATTMVYGNLFTSITNIYPEAYNLYLYSGNWKWNSGGSEPPNGIENGSGDPYFKNFDGANYIYNDDPTQASDLRLTDTSPCIDFSFQTGIPPIGPDYIDVLGKGGQGTARVDCGIFGGPDPFPDIFVPPTKPGVTIMTVTPSPVSPSGVITINAEGKIGGK